MTNKYNLPNMLQLDIDSTICFAGAKDKSTSFAWWMIVIITYSIVITITTIALAIILYVHCKKK